MQQPDCGAAEAIFARRSMSGFFTVMRLAPVDLSQIVEISYVFRWHENCVCLADDWIERMGSAQFVCGPGQLDREK
jgi:hypothetical protein